MAVLSRLMSRCRGSSLIGSCSYSVRRCPNPSEADSKLSLVSSSASSASSLGPVIKPNSPAGRSVQWAFLGCPGVGKGTYAARLSNRLGVPHISTGDLVRNELSSQGLLSSKVKKHYLPNALEEGFVVSAEGTITLPALTSRAKIQKAKSRLD